MVLFLQERVKPTFYCMFTFCYWTSFSFLLQKPITLFLLFLNTWDFFFFFFASFMPWQLEQVKHKCWVFLNSVFQGLLGSSLGFERQRRVRKWK